MDCVFRVSTTECLVSNMFAGRRFKKKVRLEVELPVLETVNG